MQLFTTYSLAALALNWRQAAALLGPLGLMLSMLWCFRALDRRLGYPGGYLAAFAVYWLGWCIVFPALLLGGLPALAGLFQPAVPLAALPGQTHALLWWPLVFPLCFMFIPRLRKANAAILLASGALGILIGVTEEILWRGVYLRLFPGIPWLGLAYPTVLFALWHLCPQSVLPNRLPGGAVSFLAYALALGLTYSVAAQQTGSIFWPTVAHSLHDALGLGGFAYAAWLARPAASRAQGTAAHR